MRAASSNLSLFAGLKFRYLKETRGSTGAPEVHRREMIPVVKLTYQLTDRTKLQVGLQGIGNLLPYSVRDLVHPERDFRQRDTVLMVTNWSDYRGYLICVTGGIKYRVKTFRDPEVAKANDERFTATFVKVILGFKE